VTWSRQSGTMTHDEIWELYRQSQDKKYKCHDSAKTETWKTMSRSRQPRKKIRAKRLNYCICLLYLQLRFTSKSTCNETDCASSFSRWRRVDGADKTNNTRLATPQLTRVDLYYPNCRSTLLHSTALYCPPYVVEAYRLHFIAVKFDKSDILQQKSVLVQLTI